MVPVKIVTEVPATQSWQGKEVAEKKGCPIQVVDSRGIKFVICLEKGKPEAELLLE